MDSISDASASSSAVACRSSSHCCVRGRRAAHIGGTQQTRASTGINAGRKQAQGRSSSPLYLQVIQPLLRLDELRLGVGPFLVGQLTPLPVQLLLLPPLMPRKVT